MTRLAPVRHLGVPALALLGAATVLTACSSGPTASGPTIRPAGPPTTGAPTTSSAPTPSSTPTLPPPSLSHAAWRAQVRGAVYAQPLVAGDRVFVATEDDDVYALSLGTGKVLWQTSIGAPLTDVSTVAGCGNVDPLGITSTPVLDAATGTLYVVGEIGGTPSAVHRQLVGLSISSGAVVRSADVDPTGGGDRPANLLQRASLVMDGGRVDVGFGGLFGDCGTYHGWMVGASTAAGVPDVEFDVTPGGSGGAIWQGGGPPSVDEAGNLYVATGNQNSPGTAGYDESVVKLSPTLAPEASFRDGTAVDDEDFGTTSPLLLPGGTLFAVGKTDIGYVLEQSDLRQVASIPGVCGSDPDGRMAFDPATDAAYVPCRGGGIQEVELSNDRLGWRSGAVNSSPVLAAGSLWALSYPGGTLQSLDPATGAIRQSTTIGQTANFATPAYGSGLLVVANATGTVEAFGP